LIFLLEDAVGSSIPDIARFLLMAAGVGAHIFVLFWLFFFSLSLTFFIIFFLFFFFFSFFFLVFCSSAPTPQFCSFFCQQNRDSTRNEGKRKNPQKFENSIKRGRKRRRRIEF